jgi:hypothetical protein
MKALLVIAIIIYIILVEIRIRILAAFMNQLIKEIDMRRWK